MADHAAVLAAVTAARPEVVFHMAGLSTVQGGLDDPVLTYTVNAIGTANVLDAIRATGHTRAVVSVTTDKVYLNQGSEWGYREDDRLGGSDPYSTSKVCQELVTSAFRDSLLADRGIAVASARAGNVIGGGDWTDGRLVPDLIRACLDGTPLEVRAPDAIRPWQHVLNPLYGYLLLAEKLWEDPTAATAWNFGPDLEDVAPGRLAGRAPGRALAGRGRRRRRRAAAAAGVGGPARRQLAGAQPPRMASALGPARRDRRDRRLAPRPPRRPRHLARADPALHRGAARRAGRLACLTELSAPRRTRRSCSGCGPPTTARA